MAEPTLTRDEINQKLQTLDRGMETLKAKGRSPDGKDFWPALAREADRITDGASVADHPWALNKSKPSQPNMGSVRCRTSRRQTICHPNDSRWPTSARCVEAIGKSEEILATRLPGSADISACLSKCRTGRRRCARPKDEAWIA